MVSATCDFELGVPTTNAGGDVLGERRASLLGTGHACTRAGLLMKHRNHLLNRTSSGHTSLKQP